jgi:hypothetical protein
VGRGKTIFFLWRWPPQQTCRPESFITVRSIGSKYSQGWRNMIGQYVRMITAPRTRMGTIIAARFDGGRVTFLFHQDPRFADKFPDAWLPNSELEECSRPRDEQIEVINNYFRDHSSMPIGLS